MFHIWATELQSERDDKIQAKASQKAPFWRLTDLENELMVAEVGDGGWGGTVREFGVDVYTLLYLKWITNKDLLWSRGNSAQGYVAAWMGGQSGGECIHIYIYD